MFPRHDQDYTVFENPCYNNLQLTINGRNVPDETLDTTEARFLHYQPFYSGDNDTYYNVDADGTTHPPQIQMWLCRDTYFIASTDSMRYISTGSPEGSQAE